MVRKFPQCQSGVKVSLSNRSPSSSEVTESPLASVSDLTQVQPFSHPYLYLTLWSKESSVNCHNYSFFFNGVLPFFFYNNFIYFLIYLIIALDFMVGFCCTIAGSPAWHSLLLLLQKTLTLQRRNICLWLPLLSRQPCDMSRRIACNTWRQKKFLAPGHKVMQRQSWDSKWNPLIPKPLVGRPELGGSCRQSSKVPHGTLRQASSPAGETKWGAGGGHMRRHVLLLLFSSPQKSRACAQDRHALPHDSPSAWTTAS